MLIPKTIKEKQSLFIVYADFESILVPENNGKQNLEEHYTNKLLAKNILLAVMAINQYVSMINYYYSNGYDTMDVTDQLLDIRIKY